MYTKTYFTERYVLTKMGQKLYQFLILLSKKAMVQAH